jgi:FtsZ-interacting cell division protein ZipA
MVGEREIERFTRSLSQQHTSGGNRQSSTQYTRIKEPLMMPGEFKDTLDTNKNGVRIVFISGKHQTRARVPFLDLPEQRAASIDSGWLSPTYKRPFWGKIPPVVETPPTQTDDDTDKKPKQKQQPQQAAPVHQAAQPTQQPKPSTQETATADAADKTLESVVKSIAPAAGVALDLAKLILSIPTPDPGAPGIAPKAPEVTPDQGFSEGGEDEADESSARDPEAGD